MRVIQATLFHIEIPCTPFETSFGTIRVRPALIVKLVADSGLIGYGEASLLNEPLSEHEVVSNGIEVLNAKLKHLMGKEIIDSNDPPSSFDKEYPVTTFAIEAAMSDLFAKEKNIPLSSYFGSEGETVPAGESIGLQANIDKMLEQIRAHVASGIGRVKIKIKPGQDIERVRAVRSAFPELILGVDANSAYGREHIPSLASLTDFNLSFIEQPFSAEDLESHRTLNTIIPVCLDESITDELSCKNAIETGACSIINIKPARIGSYRLSKRIHDICRASGVGLFGGGRLETGVGKTMNAAFYTLPGFTHASDITPPHEYLLADPAIPSFVIKDGVYKISKSSGSGIELDESVMKDFLVRAYSLSA
jgi:O-succinylbenzoate synthase